MKFNFGLQICSSIAGQALNNYLAEIKWVKNDKKVQNQMYEVEAMNAAVISPSCGCVTSRRCVLEWPELAAMNALGAAAVELQREETARRRWSLAGANLVRGPVRTASRRGQLEAQTVARGDQSPRRQQHGGREDRFRRKKPAAG